jgi:hypothetical protein
MASKGHSQKEMREVLKEAKRDGWIVGDADPQGDEQVPAHMSPSQTYEFTLLLEGPDVLSEEVFGALDEPCHDAIFGHRGGTQFADFEREASNFEEAVITAIRDVEEAVDALRVVRVQPDELVTSAAIAERVGRTPQSIN